MEPCKGAPNAAREGESAPRLGMSTATTSQPSRLAEPPERAIIKPPPPPPPSLRSLAAR